MRTGAISTCVTEQRSKRGHNQTDRDGTGLHPCYNIDDRREGPQ